LKKQKHGIPHPPPYSHNYKIMYYSNVHPKSPAKKEQNKKKKRIEWKGRKKGIKRPIVIYYQRHCHQPA